MRLMIAAGILGVMLGGASAQDRFTLEKTPEGFVRLDSKSGQVSICKESGTQLVCQMAADDRTAYEEELAIMQAKLDAIEKRVATLEAGKAPSLPTEQQFDQTMSYMQRFMQGFADIVKDLDREFNGADEPHDPIPNRT